MIWTNIEAAGLIPEFLSEHDPRPAREQIHENYAHGGGWNSFHGFELRQHDGRYAIYYPGDPAMREVSRTSLRDELIVLFQYAWLAVIQPNGTYEIARID